MRKKNQVFHNMIASFNRTSLFANVLSEPYFKNGMFLNTSIVMQDTGFRKEFCSTINKNISIY